MARRPRKHDDLAEACIAEALAIVEAEGVERLSLREVARRLGVSHQAPYRHFVSREALLAELVARAFAAFAAALEARAAAADPREDLVSLCRAYLGFAAAHPLQFRLMFATRLPDADAHPAMLLRARAAFALLSDAVARIAPAAAPGTVALDAVFAWAAVHGLAGILQTGALGKLPGTEAAMAEAASAHLLARLADAVARDP
jgi:AcrR family transcriptional regulator